MSEQNETKLMEDILYKYFRDEREIEYICDDAFRVEFGQPFITWRYLRGDRSKILLEIGSVRGDFDTIPLKVCQTAANLENTLDGILYSFRPQPDWKYTADELPKKDGLYITTILDGDQKWVSEECWYGESEGWGNEIGEVIAFMDHPEPAQIKLTAVSREG